MLKFWGRGSGFTDNHTSAFFVENNELIMIDCSITAFARIIKNDLSTLNNGEEIKRIIIAVTHTHSDHVSGIPLLIHYAFYLLHLPVTVVAPSEEVKDDLNFFISHMDGCDPRGYEVVLANDGDLGWLKEVIPTSHAPELEGRCFGYCLEVEGKRVVYTGDTNRIEDFIPYLTEGCYFFTECSLHISPVHTEVHMILKLQDLFDKLNVHVYLMHLDDEETIKERIAGSKLEFAPLYGI